MKFSKKILSLLIIFSFIFNFSIADNSDCRKFWTRSNQDILKFVNSSRETNDIKFLSIDEQKEIITNSDLNTAILNLKKYCCENNLWGLSQSFSVCQEKISNPNSLDSPFLFDHLLDVIMRRLNWLTWENDIYPTMLEGGNNWYDTVWLKRRQIINSGAESISWTNPQKIIDKYKEFRAPSPSILWYNINNDVHNVFINKGRNQFLEYFTWNIAKALKNYKEWTLYDRYSNACALSEFFYALLSTDTYSEDINKLRRLNNECNNLTNSQISSEVEYTSLVIKRSSNLFLSNYINGYISYLEKRTNNLKSIWKNSSDRFLDVVRGVPMLTNKCKK